MFNKAFQAIQNNISQGFSNIKSFVKENLTPLDLKSKIEINKKIYYEDHLIAEGGYAYIYQIISSENHKNYALKKINIQSKNHLNNIKNEIKYWKILSKYKNIIHLYDYEITEKTVFIIMELCKEGTLLDYINKKKFINEEEALTILYQIILGVYAMHCQEPPIAHRDLKIENILKFENVYKLCDFGSATTIKFNPLNCSEKEKNETLNNFESNSTIYYRAPEMCDKYNEYEINEKVDIWALGCILYTILFKIQPFNDGLKLNIISASYNFPKNNIEKYSEKIIDLIRLMLNPNPIERPSAKEILDILKNWNQINKIDLPEEVENIKKRQISNGYFDNDLEKRNGKKNIKLISQEDILRIQNNINNKINNYEKKEVDENIKNQNNNNINLLWDFDLNNNNNKINNNKTNEQNNNNNLLDFEFTDNINNNEQKENNNNNDLFEFINNSNSNDFSKEKNNNINNNNNFILNVDNTFQQNINIQQINNKEKKQKNNNNDQDIFSFFK
jgi:AP2-associated kinase